MAKREKDSSEEPKSNSPVEDDPAIVEDTIAQPTAPVKIKAMNVSATLLHLEDGTPFPSRATAELTQADFERFNKFNLIAVKS